jgi:hypothetical protein
MPSNFDAIVQRASCARFAREQLGFTPDDTQTALLNTRARRVILNCTRQWGKSTVTAAKAVHHAIHTPNSLTLILSPSERQSSELLRKCAVFFRRAGVKTKKDGINSHSLQLENDSRLIALPNSEDTIRGFSGVSLLLIDEAARVPDSLYEAVLPMLATTNGSLWMLSTPAGRRGFFYEAATTASRTQQSPDPKQSPDREGGAGSPKKNPERSEGWRPNANPERERVGAAPRASASREAGVENRDAQSPLPKKNPERSEGWSTPSSEREPAGPALSNVPSSGSCLLTSGFLSLTIPATKCPRISPTFLAEQRAARGELFYRQEYLCEFIGDQHSLFSRDLIESLLTDLIAPLEPSQAFPAAPLASNTRGVPLASRSSLPASSHWTTSTRHLTRPLPSLPGSTSGAHPYIENPGPWTLTNTRYFAGLDLGQAHDSSALVILAADTFVARERNPLDMSPVRHTVWTVVAAERFALGTPYPDIVYDVSWRFSRSPLSGASTLVLDATGVGAAVWDLFSQQRLPVELSGVVLGAGRAESSSGGKAVVPKLELVDGVRVAMEAGQLFFAAGAAGVDLLIDELSQLEASFRESGSVMVEARAGAHDDLAIALMLALWAARKRGPVSPAVQVREAEARRRLQLAL